MYSYTVWAPEPDAGATTLAANLARAHAESGKRVLAIDFAPPGDGLTARYGVEPPAEGADNVVQHLIEEEGGPFEDLVVPAEPGVDLLPTHPHLASLDETLEQNATLVELSAPRTGYTYPKHEQLRRVLFDSRAFYEYDLLVLDAEPGFGQHAYNAAYASPFLLVPVAPGAEPDRPSEAVARLESEIDDANLTALGAVANRVEGDAAGRAGGDASADSPTDEFAVPLLPVSIPDAPDLFADARAKGVSVFELADDRDLDGDERAVLAAFEALADSLFERLANPSR